MFANDDDILKCYLPEMLQCLSILIKHSFEKKHVFIIIIISKSWCTVFICLLSFIVRQSKHSCSVSYEVHGFDWITKAPASKGIHFLPYAEENIFLCIEKTKRSYADNIMCIKTLHSSSDCFCVLYPHHSGVQLCRTKLPPNKWVAVIFIDSINFSSMLLLRTNTLIFSAWQQRGKVRTANKTVFKTIWKIFTFC